MALITTNPVLTNLVAGRGPGRGYIKTALPVVNVDSFVGTYYAHDPKLVGLTQQETARAFGHPASIFNDGAPTTIPYMVLDKSLKQYIPIEQSVNGPVFFSAAAPIANRLIGSIDVKRDIDFKTAAFAALSTASRTTAVSTKWDTANGTPISDIRAKVQDIAVNTGYAPNYLMLSRAILNGIVKTTEYKNSVSNVLVPQQQLSYDAVARNIGAMCDVANVVVTEGLVYNSAKKGSTTPTLVDLYGTDALLMYLADSSSQFMADASFAKQFVPNGTLTDSNTGNSISIVRGNAVRTYWVEETLSTAIEVHSYFADVINFTPAGWSFTGVLS